MLHFNGKLAAVGLGLQYNDGMAGSHLNAEVCFKSMLKDAGTNRSS